MLQRRTVSDISWSLRNNTMLKYLQFEQDALLRMMLPFVHVMHRLLKIVMYLPTCTLEWGCDMFQASAELQYDNN